MAAPGRGTGGLGRYGGTDRLAGLAAPGDVRRARAGQRGRGNALGGVGGFVIPGIAFTAVYVATLGTLSAFPLNHETTRPRRSALSGISGGGRSNI